VPAFSENADLAVKYLNWMADAQVLQHLVYGESGVHYDTSAEGIVVPRTLAADAAWDEAVLNRALVLSGPPYATRELAARATVLPWVEDRYPLALFLSHFAMLEKDAIPPVRLENPPDSLMKLGPAVLKKGREAVAKAVAAKPGDFDAVFAAGLTEFLDAGARQIREELLKAWDAQAGR
jgi:putative aldouronate transport system substrate-binding protein